MTLHRIKDIARKLGVSTWDIVHEADSLGGFTFRCDCGERCCGKGELRDHRDWCRAFEDDLEIEGWDEDFERLFEAFGWED